MKRRILLLTLIALALCGIVMEAQAAGYTEFCGLNAQFIWQENASVRTEPYASSAKTGKTISAGDYVSIKRLVKNDYGNLWAELYWGDGFICFYDVNSAKACGQFSSYISGSAPVTATGVTAPDGEISQGTDFTFSGVLKSYDNSPIHSVDIWVAQDGTHQFDDLIWEFTTGVVTEIDLQDLNINSLYKTSELEPGSYEYTVRVNMGFTYEGYQFIFGDRSYPIQTEFTVVEKATSYAVPSGSLSTKLAYLKDVFPHGWYWNHWSASQLGSSTQLSFTVNDHATTISNKPCTSSTHNSSGSCNHYWGSWKGIQCTGFARMMFELVWDMDTETASYGMYYHPDTDNADLLDYVKPGDMVWTGGHMFLVTAVNGDTFTVVHCNKDDHCVIRWNDTYTKDWVHDRMKGNGTGYVASPTPVKYSSDITNWAKYEVVTSALNVRKWASTSVDKSCTMSKGDIFYVDLNHTITKSGNLYGYCRTEDGKYGWVQYANTSYAVPVEDTEEPTEPEEPEVPEEPEEPNQNTSYKRINVQPGEEFTVEIAITKVNEGEVARITFDVGNAPISFVKATAISENGNTVEGPTDLSGRFGIMNTSGVAIGTIGSLTLKLDENAAIGSIYNITFTGTYAAAEVSGNVQITVGSARVPGDANEDGIADIFDALLVLKYDCGWNVTLNKSNADVNADGVADIFDALLLLKYDCGWNVELL